MLSKVVGDDFVWSAITGALSGKRRTSNTNFININCPMCTSRGESADRRLRCGIKKDGEGIGIYCFNCGFRARFRVGETLSKSMKEFLTGVGVGSMDVKRLNYKALQVRNMLMGSPEAAAVVPMIYRPSFQPKSLPPGAKSLATWAQEGCTDPDFVDAASYLFGRGDAIASGAEFFWTPNTDHELNRRIILPFEFNHDVVGWTARLIDKATEDKPKYHSNVPSHFIFNSHLLNGASKFVILVEGPFDALAVNGVATLGAKISPEQQQWLNSTGKTIIVVADRDKSGGRLIDHALHNNWMVAFPKLRDGHGVQNWWDADIKDTADASNRYGKLYTMRSVLESASANKIEINVKRKLLY